MALVSNQPTKIIRTERGLVIAGTRITLYQFMDYIHGRYARSLIRQHFPQITDEQFEATMSYIEANRAEIEAEYQMVVKNDEEIRQYWEEQNRECFAQIAQLPPPPGLEKAWAKLQAAKARLESKL
ncbi:MAG TPA: DUF433 domain-containing protein [Cyanobacteria bacterium UBA12227]|nr:DUF433 domain-containing protein [Cyanobacteria bacterium UBA12227]HAX89834.1 DUF433 domain-containing protein [Cyanobacteria bacterium UBA11370]HBY78045.1 DUF433 domain-containing protein [Cyanobacteria bacterium UBA11148]